MRRFRLSPVLASLLLAGFLPTLSSAAPSIAQEDPANRPLWIRRPAVSPDGRFIAYTSDEAGRPEIYVRPYPGPGSRFQVSPKSIEWYSPRSPPT